jgi:DNA-binding NtrC family response regulator
MPDTDQQMLKSLQLSLENIDYSKYPILLVDDDRNVLETMTAIFEDTFTVDSTTKIEDAIRMLHEKEYAVLVSDQKMPELSGVGLLAMAKEMVPKTIRVLLTGYTDLESAIEAINESYVFRYVQKNISTEEKETHIKDAIEHYLLTQYKEPQQS